jgi:hypothetical protein
MSAYLDHIAEHGSAPTAPLPAQLIALRAATSHYDECARNVAAVVLMDEDEVDLDEVIRAAIAHRVKHALHPAWATEDVERAARAVHARVLILLRGRRVVCLVCRRAEGGRCSTHRAQVQPELGPVLAKSLRGGR